MILRNLEKLMKDRGKEQYMPKRNCVRTVDERKIHDKAVKMRKNDRCTAVEYVENRVEKARSEGFNSGKVKAVATKRGQRNFLPSFS